MTDDVKALVEPAQEWDARAVQRNPEKAARYIRALAEALEAATSAPERQRCLAGHSAEVAGCTECPYTFTGVASPAVDREALAKVIHDVDYYGLNTSEKVTPRSLETAERILSSGLLRDVRDVQAEGAELAADWLAQQLWPDAADYAGHVRQFAQTIREARNER